MGVAIVTGSAGLIGSEASRYFADLGMDVVGIDNDMRRTFFGDDASTHWNRLRLEDELGRRYRHLDLDIRDSESLMGVVRDYGDQLDLLIHAAAQPSHDWAAKDPPVDFGVNAVGTLNLLEAGRQ